MIQSAPYLGDLHRAAVAVVLSLPLAIWGCVGDPQQELDPGWVDVQPGVGKTVSFQDESGYLDGVFLSVPPEAVSHATAFRVSVAMSDQPVFLLAGTGVQLRTPAIRIEPFNRLFNVPVGLTLPWFSHGETVVSEDLRGWSSDGLEGIPLGLWDPVTDITGTLPTYVTLNIVRGGYYWAGNWEDNPFREADRDVGTACEQTHSRQQSCDSGQTCLATGCMHDVCGAVTEVTYCLPTTFTVHKFNCRCACSASVCQWVQ